MAAQQQKREKDSDFVGFLTKLSHQRMAAFIYELSLPKRSGTGFFLGRPRGRLSKVLLRDHR